MKHMFAKEVKKKPGAAQNMARSRVFDPAEAPEARRTIMIASVVVAVAFLALFARLWYLQLLQGDHFRAMSENNRIRLLDVPPSRGLIFDAKGRLLAENRPAFALAVVPEDVNDWDELATRLNKLVGITPEEIKKVKESAAGQPPFKPVRLRAHLDREQLAVLETFRYELPGIKVLVEYRRAYLNAKDTAHLIGYLGEINPAELGEAPKALYRLGDYVGRYGLEKSRERVLHGRRGARQVEVDAMGRELKLLDERDALPGHNITLTVDLKMQQAAAEALGDEVGAVVALDPRNGQVYCLYSNPSFDQNNFITGMTPRIWEALAHDPFHPLKDRAISGLYPPGSTYKIITAAAALSEGVATPQTSVICTGEMPFGRRSYRCWAYKKGGHGSVALHKALRESCDVYFYRMGLRLGVDRLAKYARAFGLGQPTGIPLASEANGLVPDSEWKRRRFGEPWQDGETLSLAIGQGFNLVTPLQLARMVAVIANRGRLVTPTLVKAVSPPDGSDPVPEPPGLSSRVPVSAQNLELIHQGLVAVVNEPGGTGSSARLPGITVAGKTGSAQVVGLKHEKAFGREENLPWRYRDHALFVCYAPAEDPTIAMAVVVEHGLHGGSAAAPVARKVLETFFELPHRPEKVEAARGPLANRMDPVEAALAAAAAAAAQKKAVAEAKKAGLPAPSAPGQAPPAPAPRQHRLQAPGGERKKPMAGATAPGQPPAKPAERQAVPGQAPAGPQPTSPPAGGRQPEGGQGAQPGPAEKKPAAPAAGPGRLAPKPFTPAADPTINSATHGSGH